MEINKRNGFISSIKTNVKSKDVRDDVEKYQELMLFYTKEFINMQLYKGDELINYAEEKDINIGDMYIIFKHSKGVALCYVSSSSFYNSNIRPAIDIDICGNDFTNGWTFTRGNMSDIYMHLNSEYIWLSTRDTLAIHDLFLVWIMEKLENHFYTDEKYPKFEAYNSYENYALFSEIMPEFDAYINVNKNKRIDKLIVNDLSVEDYVIKNSIFSYVHSETDIFKICMIYQKPYKQISNYIQKHHFYQFK